MVAPRVLIGILSCVLFASGCGPKSKVPNNNSVPPVEATAQLPGPPPQVPGPPPQVPGPPQVAAAPATKPVKLEQLVLFSKIEFDENQSFAEISQRFATARAKMSVLPCANTELALLYRAIGRIGFRGSQDSAGLDEQMRAWIADQPKEPAPLVTLLAMRLEQAWQARGGGIASLTSPAQFGKFREHLQEGKQFGDQALATGVNDPELYTKLILLGTGMGLERPQVEAWARASQEQFPKYHPTYENYAQYLLPRWHGKPGEIERYAESLLAAIPGDDGLEAYARVIGFGSIADKELLCYSDLDHATVLKGVKLLRQRYPQAGKFIEYAAIAGWRNFDHALCLSLHPALQQMKAKKFLNLPLWYHEKRFEQFIAYCNSLPVPQKPQQMFWPSLASTSSVVFVENGAAVMTASDTTPSPLPIFKTTNLSRPASYLPPPSNGMIFFHADRLSRHLLATTKDGKSQAFVIDLANLGRQPLNYQAPEVVQNWDLSADGSLAVAIGVSGCAHFWNPATGEPIFKTEPLKHTAVSEFCQLLSPDGKLLAVNSSQGFELRNTSDGQVAHKFPVLGQQPVGQPVVQTLISFLPDGAFVGIGSKKSGDRYESCLFHCDPKTNQFRDLGVVNKNVTPLGIHSDKFVVLSGFNPNNTVLITVHDLRTGKVLRKIDGQPRIITCAAISPDGTKLVTSDDVGIGRLWALSP